MKKKKGSMAFVLVLAVLIPIVMVALTSFLYINFQAQQKVGNDMGELQTIDNIVMIAGDVGEYYLKHHIDASVQDPDSKDDAFWTAFASANTANLQGYVLNKMPSEYVGYIKNMNVSFMVDILEYRHGLTHFGYDAIVLTIEVETKNAIETHNIAYFINNADGYSNDGTLFTKGEFVYSWIS